MEWASGWWRRWKTAGNCGDTSRVTAAMPAPVICRFIFGLGEEQVVRTIEIRWPSGQVQVLKDVEVDQILKVEEPR